MIKRLLLGCALLLAINTNLAADETTVKDEPGLKAAIENAAPGDVIVLANGVWKDVQIRFSGNGTAEQPITLRAETPGKVRLEGESSLKLAGEYLVVDGLYFTNGYTPSGTVIAFRINRKNIANHCKVINTVIEDFSQPERHQRDLWVEFFGRHNQLDHCYLAGKANKGPTLRVNLRGNEHIHNYHQITNNYFGPRPRHGGPQAETIQIGASYTSMAPSYVNVANNFFDRCDGEVEVISSKSNFNTFKNNVFFECEGSLVFRHGNYCIADGNLFIGNPASDFHGGIRVINTGHWVTNNYFYSIKGDEFRGALAIMNGIPKSPLNRYNQVTDAVIAHNTWVNCGAPWKISVGANNDKKDVLPASEIRSARPERVVVANNLIYNSQSDNEPIKAYDKIDGIHFKNNLVAGTGNTKLPKGLSRAMLKMNQPAGWLAVPAGQDSLLADVHAGFGFEDIKTDVFGNSRSSHNQVGAVSGKAPEVAAIMDKSKYGPAWFKPKSRDLAGKVHTVGSSTKELVETLAAAGAGDRLVLEGETYQLDQPLKIDKAIVIVSKSKEKPTTLKYSGAAGTALFQLHPRSRLVLKYVALEGTGEQHAFAPLREKMTYNYDLFVRSAQVENFASVLHAWKGSFADSIYFKDATFRNNKRGLVLAAETRDKGDYNAEFVWLRDCRFENIKKDVINYYRGGYDESTIGGNLLVENSSFMGCGEEEESQILIKTRGIINVNLANNTFKNNPVKLIAFLWGEKNNKHSGNNIQGEATIRVEKYLKQKLMY